MLVFKILSARESEQIDTIYKLIEITYNAYAYYIFEHIFHKLHTD